MNNKQKAHLGWVVIYILASLYCAGVAGYVLIAQPISPVYGIPMAVGALGWCVAAMQRLMRANHEF